MAGLTSREILAVWERGQGRSPVERALALAAFAEPEMSWDELAALQLGQRDKRLLAVREQTFGPRIATYARCPSCAQPLAMRFSASDVRATPTGEDPSQSWELAVRDLTLRYRLPDSNDLAAAGAVPTAQAAYALLVERCVVRATRAGEAVPASRLPPEVIQALAGDMAERDPQAEVLLDLACPACACPWQEVFDIASFFWAELAAEARRLALEVHALARAYAWREADILAMSSLLRQLYLDLVGAAE